MDQVQTIQRLKLYLSQVIARLEQAPHEEIPAIADEPWADVAGPMEDGGECQFEVQALGEETFEGKDVTRFAVTVSGGGECIGADFFVGEVGRWRGDVYRYVDGVATPLAGDAGLRAGSP